MDNGANSYRRFLAGDDSGFVELVRDYKDGLMLFLNRYTNDIYAAEELMEETFYRLAIKKPRFTAQYSFKTWLYTIGRNLALNELKRTARLSPLPVEERPDGATEADALERRYIQSETRMALYQALARLSPDYRTVLHLVFLEGLTNAQAARVLQKNPRQIANLVYRAKHALRSELEQEGFTYEGLS